MSDEQFELKTECWFCDAQEEVAGVECNYCHGEQDICGACTLPWTECEGSCEEECG